MKVEEFRKGVLQTASCDWEKIHSRITSDSSCVDPWVMNWMHSVVGIQSELGEFLSADGIENLLEELGDMLWYTTLGLNCFDANPKLPDVHHLIFSHVFESAADSFISTVISITQEISSAYKAFVFYGRDVDKEDMVELYENLSVSIFKFANMLSCSPFELMEKNQEKLRNKFKGRYRSGSFNEEEANTRDVEAEYEAMRLTEDKNG
jgi:hypothetical protein